MENGERSLMAAIVTQAIKDYESVLQGKEEHKYSSKRELERFFKSAWCKQLLSELNIDYSLLTKKIDELRKKYKGVK